MPRPSPAEDVLEIYRPPVFLPGARVRATQVVRNDGSFPGKDVGAVLVERGDLGYVRDVGVFLSRHHVYAVEIIERGVVVGMRAHELEAAPRGERP